jgi:hypothetical protein
LVSRLASPKSPGSLIVVGPQRSPFLVVLLDLRGLVVHVQGRHHSFGDDPGAEAARDRTLALADDAPVEDQPDLVGAPDVVVVVQDLFEEDPPGHRPVQHLGQGELGRQDRQVVPVAGGLVVTAERVGQNPQPLTQ